MSQNFELVRRIGDTGGRVIYEVRNAFGEFRPTGFGEAESFELAEHNIGADIEAGLYDASEVTEFLNPEVEVNFENLDEVEINFDTPVETTPLVEGVVSTGAGAAATSGGSGVGAAIAGTAVGVGVATGIGLNVATNWGTDEYNPSPGRHYLGPGNTLSGRTPVDSADEIAKYHDELYELALDQEDITKADVIAIDSFDEDYKRTGNWGSFLGRLGLSFKKTVEDRFGIIYPSGLPTRHFTGT